MNESDRQKLDEVHSAIFGKEGLLCEMKEVKTIIKEMRRSKQWPAMLASVCAAIAVIISILGFLRTTCRADEMADSQLDAFMVENHERPN